MKIRSLLDTAPDPAACAKILPMQGLGHLVVAVCLLSGCQTRQTTQQLASIEAQLGETRVQLERVQAERERERAEVARLESRLALLEAWSSQSQEHSLGLAKTLDEVVAAISRLRTRAGDVGPGEFRKGDRARRGMTDLEIRQHATAQGDPHFGRFSLDEALADDPRLAFRSHGALTATFETSMGSFDCVLHEDEAPLTVANFVGLARGQRASLDPKTDTWTRRRLYEGTIFHRVIASFMIQGGDPLGTGRGGPGYVIPDEFDTGLLHRPGALAMANAGPGTGGSQFFITVGNTPHLDGKHAVFGQCALDRPMAVSEVAVDVRAMNRPLVPIEIHHVQISRKRASSTRIRHKSSSRKAGAGPIGD